MFYLTSSTTAHAEGTASCSIDKTTSPCAITVNATDASDPAEHDDGSTHPDTFTLTYTLGGTPATVGGTIADGRVEVSAQTHGGSHSASARISAGGRARTLAVSPAQPAPVTPVVAALTGSFSASLLGVSLSGGRCGTGALVYADGTTAGDLSCLLLGAAGINIDLNLRLASGTTGAGTATMSGTATITVGGALPLTLPAAVTLTGTGITLTVGGVTLPALPIASGGVQIG